MTRGKISPSGWSASHHPHTPLGSGSIRAPFAFPGPGQEPRYVLHDILVTSAYHGPSHVHPDALKIFLYSVILISGRVMDNDCVLYSTVVLSWSCMSRRRQEEGLDIIARRNSMLDRANVPAVQEKLPPPTPLRDSFDEENLVPLESFDMSIRPISPDLVKRLASLQLDDDELMDVLQIDSETLVTVYGAAVAAGRAQGKIALRRMQWRKAMQGNVPMLVHLGNQYLGQKDAEKTVNHKVDGKVTHEIVDGSDPREKLMDMMRVAAERLQKLPPQMLPQPTIQDFGDI